MNILINPIHHPLLQILISLILISSILYIGKKINNLVFTNYSHPLLNISTGAIALSQLIYFFLLIGGFKQFITYLSYTLILLGLVNLKSLVKFKKIKNLLNLVRSKTIEIIIILSFILFIIISVGPPSMADALDYHYGVPLYLLKFENLIDLNLWPHGHLFGSGELLNAVPLFLNVDNFSSLFQVIALILFLNFLKEKEKNKLKITFISIFIISSPVILFLVSGPKFLLFPQILTTLALYIFIKSKKMSLSDYILISVLLMGATQFKISFILSGFIIGLLSFIKIFKDDKKVLLYTFVLILFFFLPRALYNYENVLNFKLINIITILPIEFLDYLKAYRHSNFIYPLNLFIPNGIGAITTILGFQFFLIFFISKMSTEFKIILKIFLTTILFHFFLGQNSGKLYFEFLLWLSVGFLFIKNENFNYSFFTKLILPQMLLVFCAALYFSVITFPSLISLKSRDNFMHRNTLDYSAIKWVNNQLPKDSIVISKLRSVALFNNNFIPLIDSRYSGNSRKEYIEKLKIIKPNFIVLDSHDIQNSTLKGCIKEQFGEAKSFFKSTRNPFNRNDKDTVYIYHFHINDFENCSS